MDQLLWPYATPRAATELYGQTYQRCYDIETVGLRHFNVFVRRQDPWGPCAAVIPGASGCCLPASAVQSSERGEQSGLLSRGDLCAGVPAGRTALCSLTGEVYNVTCGERSVLNELLGLIRNPLATVHPGVTDAEAVYRDFCPADVRRSVADISNASERLRYRPKHSVWEGQASTFSW